SSSWSQRDNQFTELAFMLLLIALDRLLTFFGHQRTRSFVRSRANVVNIGFRNDHALFSGALNYFAGGHATRELTHECCLIALAYARCCGAGCLRSSCFLCCFLYCLLGSFL